MHDPVLMQHSQRLSRLGDPAQHTRHRKTRRALVDKDTGQVHPLHPIQHQHVATTVEQIVASMRQPRMRRKRQQRPRLDEQAVAGPVVRHDANLQRDESLVSRVDGLEDGGLTATADDLQRLVAAADAGVSHVEP